MLRKYAKLQPLLSAGTFAVRCRLRSFPDIVHEDPQELGGRGGGGQRAVGEAAQEDGVFMPGSAGEAIDASDDLERVCVVLVCHFRIKPLRWLHQPVRVERGKVDRIGKMEKCGAGCGETEAIQQIIDFGNVRYGIHAASVPSSA